MKRFIVILLLIPSLVFGTYTEFYCISGGSQINAGSTTSTTAAYTSTSGNWSTVTNIFTPTDGSTPASTVAVNDYVDVYANGATAPGCIRKVTAVGAGVNGTITTSATVTIGTCPSTASGTRSIKAGGAMLGPSAADTWPFTSGTAWAGMANSAGDQVRINVKNNQTYTVTTTLSLPSSVIVQGYTTTVGDGGRATFTTSTAGSSMFNSAANASVFDLEIASTASSSNAFGISGASNSNCNYVRLVIHGWRGAGLVAGTQSNIIEVEAYDNNKGNTSTSGQDSGIVAQTGCKVFSCYSHDNTGSNANGFSTANTVGDIFVNCIADSNGKDGFRVDTVSALGNFALIGCDSYNNGGDGINLAGQTAGSISTVWIQNCNLIKNTGKGINKSSTATIQGYVYNCGYGSGTQANSGGDSALGSLIESGKITYASNVTPYSAPTTGNFSNVLAAAQGVGRSFFLETDGTNTGTVGFPDIGAAQANIGVPFPTPTATPTATPVQTSYAFPQ